MDARSNHVEEGELRKATQQDDNTNRQKQHAANRRMHFLQRPHYACLTWQADAGLPLSVQFEIKNCFQEQNEPQESREEGKQGEETHL